MKAIIDIFILKTLQLFSVFKKIYSFFSIEYKNTIIFPKNRNKLKVWKTVTIVSFYLICKSLAGNGSNASERYVFKRFKLKAHKKNR